MKGCCCCPCIRREKKPLETTFVCEEDKDTHMLGWLGSECFLHANVAYHTSIFLSLRVEQPYSLHLWFYSSHLHIYLFSLHFGLILFYSMQLPYVITLHPLSVYLLFSDLFYCVYLLHLHIYHTPHNICSLHHIFIISTRDGFIFYLGFIFCFGLLFCFCKFLDFYLILTPYFFMLLFS